MADPMKNDGKKFIAKLIRGQTYVLPTVRFDRNIRVIIDETTKNYLYDHAVEEHQSQDQEESDSIIVKDKFIFEDYDGPFAVGTMLDKPVNDAETNRKREREVARTPMPTRVRAR